MSKFPLLLCLLTLSATADDVYRWVGPDGIVHYSDHAPTNGAAPVALPPLQTFDPQSIAGGQPLGPANTTAAPSAPNFKPKIARPQDKETFRDPQGTLTISLAEPPKPGIGLVYYLDGKALNSEPISAPDFSVNDLQRGEHSIQVAAIDENGKEFSRSDNVVVYVMPPRVGIAPTAAVPIHHR